MNGNSNSPLGNDSNQPNGMMPYSLGYSYPSGVAGFTATSNSRMRSYSSNGVGGRRMDLGPISAGPGGYSPRSESTPQSATFSSYTSSPMATPNSFSMMSAPHHITSFPNHPYMRHEGSPTEQFPSVGELVGEENGDNGDNNSGENMPSF